MFTYQSARLRRSFVLLVAIVLGAWTMLFGLGANLSVVQAAQMASRSIVMESSAVSFADAQYQVSFTLNTAADSVHGLVLQFCEESPIIGETCTAPDGLTVDAGNLSITGVSGFSAADLANDADHSTANTLMLDATDGNTGATVHLHLGAGSGAANGITNTSNLGSFYARILTYAAAGDNDTYTATAPGTYLDDGGIALATTNKLNVTARVQEILQFCVGDTDADSAHTCADISGTTIYVGVLDPTDGAESKSSENGAAGDKYGFAMLSTNAQNGATLSYIGKTLESGVSNHVDAIGTTESVITHDVAWFGMDVDPAAIDHTNGSTENMSLDTAFDTATQWTYSGSEFMADTVATASTVVNREMVRFDFGGDADMVTPTGIYTAAVTFIGTGLF